MQPPDQPPNSRDDYVDNAIRWRDRFLSETALSSGAVLLYAGTAFGFLLQALPDFALQPDNFAFYALMGFGASCLCGLLALVSRANFSASMATKAAHELLTRAKAIELGRGHQDVAFGDERVLAAAGQANMALRNLHLLFQAQATLAAFSTTTLFFSLLFRPH